METVGPSKNVVVSLVDWKGASEHREKSKPPEPPPAIADISIRLYANGDVAYERHNVNTCTARSLMIGCYVMLGETMELVGET